MSDKDRVDLDTLNAFFNEMANNFPTVQENALNQIADQAFDEIQKNYQEAIKEPDESMDFSLTGGQNSKTVSMSGVQAIYSEFGTGTEGTKSPHPQKADFSLNPYNSGTTIRKATTTISKLHGIPIDGLYWTYRNANGDIIYTQGIPAQKEVYNTVISIKDKIPTIIKKNMLSLLKKK